MSSDQYFWVRTNKVSEHFVPATLSGGLYYIAGFSFPFRADQLVEIGQEIVWQKEDNAEEDAEKAVFEKNTVVYWLNQIEDKEVKQKALSNLWPTSANQLAYSIFQAIGMAFCWSDSTEGADFWIQVRNKYGKEEEKED